MSDWLDIPDNPTICIQADHARCLNCNRRVSNVFAKRHALDDLGMDGCGIEFKYVTTAYSGHKQQVSDLRDDLVWRDVEWAS